MFKKVLVTGRWVKLAGVLFTALLIAAGVFILSPKEAEAHCDSTHGPVASAAREALETGNVKVVLPYVSEEDEAELSAAFQQARQVRGMGAEARALADQYFVETAVRLHREGEGAPYTGLTDEDVPEAIVIADEAMATGDLDPVYEFLDEEMREQIALHYEEVAEAREHAEEEGTVEAHRARVQAELSFEKYIYGLYELITGPIGHEGGEHQH